MGPFFMHTPPRETTAEITSLSPSVDWNGTPTPGEVFILEGDRDKGESTTPGRAQQPRSPASGYSRSYAVAGRRRPSSGKRLALSNPYPLP